VTQAGVSDAIVMPIAVDDIVAGPDGNLWLTADGGVIKLTTAGATTFYPLPASVAGPGHGAGSICAGPDGNLWIGIAGLPIPYVGRVTTAGAITAYPIRTAADSVGWLSTKIGCLGSSIYLAAGNTNTQYATVLAQIATDGTVTQLWRIPRLSADGDPVITGFALGPDQNPWFVDWQAETVDVWVQH
jgi:streptogramin lyase